MQPDPVTEEPGLLSEWTPGLLLVLLIFAVWLLWVYFGRRRDDRDA